MYAEIQAVIASARLLGDIIKASKDLRDSSELAAAVSEVNTKLLHVGGVALAGQEKQAALTARIQELEQEIVRLKEWDTEANEHEPLEISRGVFAYLSKERVGSLESSQKLCSNCFHQHTKSFLQQAREERRDRSLTCNRCKARLVFHSYLDET